MPFFTPLDFEGGPQIEPFGIEANKIRKNGVLDRVTKKHEFQWIQNERPEVANVMFYNHACCNLRGLGGYEI
jgi:hypothetical protein